MTTEQNKALVRRFYQTLDANNGAGMAELVASDWVNLDPSMPPLHGLAGAQQLVARLKSAFPD